MAPATFSAMLLPATMLPDVLFRLCAGVVEVAVVPTPPMTMLWPASRLPYVLLIWPAAITRSLPANTVALCCAYENVVELGLPPRMELPGCVVVTELYCPWLEKDCAALALKLLPA